MSLLKIIGTLSAILILSGIIHSWVSQPEKQALYPINQDNHIERTDTFTKGSKQPGVDTIDQTNAQAKIAWTYYNGDGVAKDYAEALKWFSLAADGGSAAAQVNLGWMYYNGEGVTIDYVEALKWFQKAADQGYPQAWSFVKMTEDAARKK